MQQYKIDILEQVQQLLEDIKNILKEAEITNPYILQNIDILIGKHDYLTKEIGLQQILEGLYEDDSVNNDISQKQYCKIISEYSYILEDNFNECGYEY